MKNPPSIRDIEPRALWHIFADICKIPHASGHEAELREYISNFASAHGCKVQKDNFGNLLVRKPATPGAENAPTVVMQAHLDMVTQKNSDLPFDFMTDAIKPVVTGTKVTASGTTLGADNGIGVAAALAAMTDDNIQHGSLQGLFTVEEETGLFGAANLAPEFVNADIMLNLDGENLKEIYIGCAGGARTTITLDYIPQAVSKGFVGCTVAITGMKGGHSGADINTGRGNSHKEMAMFLQPATEKFMLELSSINGGNADNAIPRETFVTLAVPKQAVTDFKQYASAYARKAVARLGARAPEFKLDLTDSNSPTMVFPLRFQQNLLKAMNECPDGVIKMSPAVPDLVETSTNLAIITTAKRQVTIKSSQRSSINSKRAQLSQSIGELWSVYGGKWKIDSEYLGWEPRPEAKLIRTVQQAYQHKLGFEPHSTAIHAGLECGIIGALNPAMEIISFGPDINAPHSPDENVNIASVADFWTLLLEILHNLMLNG